MAFDNHRFRTLLNQRLYEETVCHKEIIAEVGFNLQDNEYPEVKQQISLRGWRRLASPRKAAKTMIREFFANACSSEDEMDGQEIHPYTSRVRGYDIDFSPATIRRIMRFKAEIQGAENSYENRQNDDQQLDAGLGTNCQLGFPSTIYKLCKEVGVRMREFRNMEEVDVGRYITKEVMEAVRIPRIFLPIIDNVEEDEPMPQYVPPYMQENEGGNAEFEAQEQEHHQPFEQPPPQHHFEQQPPQYQ
ncbi:hypothetical protein PIB30_078181 [Stylosanthes scabra]|uniref:Uncharacterized protein n=1 Tax=Stylosanthes scabra TaxID=79078 RepID=A0ABU6WQH1_9FABA|nr:hypothetical protein [Stylosanthes scabra]